MGPYHPALAQPFALIPQLRGETVAEVLSPGLGYCQRGIVELVEGKTPTEALPIIERTCSLAHESHRIAFCQALEMAANTKISSTAESTRVLFAEIERMLARLWTLALAARAASAMQLYQLALEQRESIFAALEAATGERHYWRITLPGGARTDLQFEPLQETLNVLQPGLAGWEAIAAPTGQLGRSGVRIGIITEEQVNSLGLGGLAARGSSRQSDLRVTQPYAGYSDYAAKFSGDKDDEGEEEAGTGQSQGSKPAGDVTARLSCAASDLIQSYGVAQAAISRLVDEPQGPTANEPELATELAAPAKNYSAASSVEGPHGMVSIRFSYTNAGVISGLALETPGARLVQALPQLLDGRLLPQLPLILASLDLCIECLDQ